MEKNVREYERICEDLADAGTGLRGLCARLVAGDSGAGAGFDAVALRLAADALARVEAAGADLWKAINKPEE